MRITWVETLRCWASLSPPRWRACSDAGTLIAVAILLGSVGLAAAALPAHRAATIDPMAALRRE